MVNGLETGGSGVEGKDVNRHETVVTCQSGSRYRVL